MGGGEGEERCVVLVLRERGGVVGSGKCRVVVDSNGGIGEEDAAAFDGADGDYAHPSAGELADFKRCGVRGVVERLEGE